MSAPRLTPELAARIRAGVQRAIDGMTCSCWDAPSMEQITDPCTRCELRELAAELEAAA